MARPNPKSKKATRMHPRRVEHPEAKCPRHPKKEWRHLVEVAWAAGWWCERRRKYIYCFALDDDGSIVKVPMSPGDWRTIRNKTRDFRDAGLEM